MQPRDHSHYLPLPRSVKQIADDARRRMEGEIAGLAAIERELDRLDRQLSELRAQLVRDRPPADS